MSKIIFLFAVLLLYTSFLFPQAAVDIPLILDDGISSGKTVYFGLDPTATDCLDPLLGESDLPPFPPPGIFEARFDLTSYCGSPISSYKDYRNAPAFPYTGTKQSRLIWQFAYLGAPLVVHYDLPDYVTIQFGNGPILSDSGVYIITDPITSAPLNIVYTNALPVELISFTGIQEGSVVILNWTTASETNNKGFELHRKILDWEVISFIEGHGTTTEKQSYSYTDDLSSNEVSGLVFYRLKQIDFDGTAAYSDEIEIDLYSSPDNFYLSQNYPNPFNPSTTISYSIPEYSNVSLKVFDILGNEIETLVNEEKPGGQYEAKWNAEGLTGGVYFYQFRAGSYSETKKMLLIK